MYTSLVPRVFLLRKGEPGTFYHVHDIKGRQDLIMWGWTKLGAHAQAFLSLLQINTVLVHCLRFCSQ